MNLLQLIKIESFLVMMKNPVTNLFNGSFTSFVSDLTFLTLEKTRTFCKFIAK